VKETKFIEQNKEKWQAFETLLQSPKPSVDELSQLYIQITDDLSYAQTFYPNRSIKIYLNGLAQKIITKLQQSRKQYFKAFFYFWDTELPLVIWSARKQLFFSALVFLVAVFIGVLSTIKDPNFPTKILGAQYMQMTETNIAKGEPMDVYSHGSSVISFLQITSNNILVAFITFINGIFFTIGTLFYLLYNGIMLGAFQWYFVQKGQFINSFLSIWLHGTLEIASIIVAGGAGITLGTGMLFPGTHSRWQGFQLGARRAFKILMGTVPLFLIAGFIESFLTRYTHAPNSLKALLIASSALFIVIYFFWLPYRRRMQSRASLYKEIQLQQQQAVPKVTGIKRNGDIIGEAFSWFQKIHAKWFTIALLLSIFLLVMNLLNVQLTYREILTAYDDQNYNFDNKLAFENVLTSYFYIEQIRWLFLVHSLSIAIVLVVISNLLSNQLQSKTISALVQVRNVVVTWAFTSILLVTLLLSVYLTLLLLPFLLAFVFLIVFTMIHENLSAIDSLKKSTSLYFANFAKVIGLNLVIGFLCFAFLGALSRQFGNVAFMFLKWNLVGNEFLQHLFNFCVSGFLIWVYLAVVGFWMIANSILYFSLEEISNAKHLKETILAMKPKRKIYGKEFDN